MSIREIRVSTLAEALAALEDIASKDDVVFRGHSDVTWRLSSTLSRFTGKPHESWDTLIDDLLTHFLNSLASVGQLPKFSLSNRRSRLEYGRHYGVPSPLIDFTLSPYIALFFAFNGIRPRPKEQVAVYALSTNELALAWARRTGTYDEEARWSFLHDDKAGALFEHGYPEAMLKFLRFPASWNRRMQRQMGAFLYDTLDHRVEDLEAFLDRVKEPAGSNLPVLTKVFCEKSFAGRVFERLLAEDLSENRQIRSGRLSLRSSARSRLQAGYSNALSS